MISNHATATNFSLWEEKAKTMSNHALWWGANDALMAAEACDSFDPIRANKLRDEAYVYRMEARRRFT